jgi:hypothetical protein
MSITTLEGWMEALARDGPEVLGPLADWCEDVSHEDAGFWKWMHIKQHYPEYRDDDLWWWNLDGRQKYQPKSVLLEILFFAIPNIKPPTVSTGISTIGGAYGDLKNAYRKLAGLAESARARRPRGARAARRLVRGNQPEGYGLLAMGEASPLLSRKARLLGLLA